MQCLMMLSIRLFAQLPTPAYVVKTAATKLGVVISYMTAYRALRFQTSSVRNAVVKNFEMVIPFFKGLKKSNPGSVIGYTRDEEKRLEMNSKSCPNLSKSV